MRDIGRGVSNLIPPSGYYLSNRLGRLVLESFEETLGRNGLNALLNLKGMGRFIDTPPPDDHVPAFDIANVSNLNRALELVYGPRGARGLALRCGRALFDLTRSSDAVPLGINELAFRVLPAQTRLKRGLTSLARALSQQSDLGCRVEERGTAYEFTVERCAACWGHVAKQPVCHLMVGLLQEAPSVFSRGQEFRVVQTECRAMGAVACVFCIDKEPIA